jgi:hypothetical protein
MVFMGQFRIEEGALPVEGIFINGDSWVHARITSKEIIEQEEEEDADPHKGAFYDEDVGGYIRLFPEDECIQITYTVLKDLPTKEDVEVCMEHIENQGKEVWERSEEIRREREKAELQVWVAEQNRLYVEQKAKEAAEKAADEAIVPDVILEDIHQEINSSDSKVSRHCGCDEDPYTDDETPMETTIPEVVQEEICQDEDHEKYEEYEYNHSDGDESWHCGCEYDPYPDDPYCGRPPPDFEYELDLRKATGEARHAKKAAYKGNKHHSKPLVFKKECEDHAHHKQRVLRNSIAAQKKNVDL